MQAATRTKYGDPSILIIKEVERPTPKPNEVLIKVHATTVNRTDIGVLTGKPFVFRFFTGLLRPRYNIIGTDFAGQIVEVGDKVKDYIVGDKVWGFFDHGLPTHAEYFAMPESGNMVKIPKDWSYNDIVSCGEGAHYARNFINKVNLKPRQKALVNGATGGIGSALIQMLLHYDIEVDSVCGTPNVDLIKFLGANHVYDYLKEDFTTTSTKYDYVFDAVGKSDFNKCKPILLPKGIYISSELGPGAENLYLPLTTKYSKGKRVIFPFPSDIKASLAFMNKIIEEGHFHPVIDRIYPLEKIEDAFRYVMTGQKIGNVVISIH